MPLPEQKIREIARDNAHVLFVETDGLSLNRACEVFEQALREFAAETERERLKNVDFDDAVVIIAENEDINDPSKYRVDVVRAWTQKDCICDACEYEWLGMVPDTTVPLECPNCHELKGRVNKKQYHGNKWMPCMYATFYGMLREVAMKHGYALAIHGTLYRDLDLIAIPWIEKTESHLDMMIEMRRIIGIERADGQIYDSMEQKPHGRITYTISTGGGGYIDLSVIIPQSKDSQ